MARKNKVILVGTAAAAAVVLGAGLFAWSANQVDVSAVTAGQGDAAVQCTTATLNVSPDVVYDSGTSTWTVPGLDLTSTFVPGSESTDATLCDGLEGTVRAYDANDEVLAAAAFDVAVVTKEIYNPSLTLPAAPVYSDVAYWTVVIK